MHYTHLVTKHSDSSCRGNLIDSEPHSGEASGDSQDARLCERGDRLTCHEESETTGVDGETLCRCADRVEGCSYYCDDAQTLAIQQPRCREDERDVGKHVDHGQPVDCHLLLVRVSGQRLVVVSMDDVEDDVQVDPLVSVAGGKSGKEKHHDPASLKHAHGD